MAGARSLVPLTTSSDHANCRCRGAVYLNAQQRTSSSICRPTIGFRYIKKTGSALGGRGDGVADIGYEDLHLLEPDRAEDDDAAREERAGRMGRARTPFF